MAVKTYSLSKDGNKYCSEHTQVREMASFSGSKVYSDTVLVDTDLMLKIEQLFAKLNCSKYIISSGYRTAAHDKAVGGSGYGQHTLGKAVDACFYDKSGKIIPAQIVCCIAQDIGFKGIANISRNYKYVHLDMRDNGTYKGNEVVSFNTVTTDFYKYFGKTKADIAKYTGDKVVVSKPATSTAKKPAVTATATEAAKFYSKSLAGTYKVTADSLNVRKGAGVTKTKIVTIPKGTAVKCYGYYTSVLGTKWLYVQFTYKGVTYTGFASSKYLVK